MPDAHINALAFRLCEAWQKAQRRQHGFTLDEIGAFMAGVVATEEEFTPEIERLRALLGKLRWTSIEKDNMEFCCNITCYVMDEIRAALEPKP